MQTLRRSRTTARRREVQLERNRQANNPSLRTNDRATLGGRSSLVETPCQCKGSISWSEDLGSQGMKSLLKGKWPSLAEISSFQKCAETAPLASSSQTLNSLFSVVLTSVPLWFHLWASC